ncbi:hypothetical protein CDIK_0902 [Cucumispora dikerogammari]|nr:hypothetical protein CDIK_0902 [Cucumispora dikerogammari]
MFYFCSSQSPIQPGKTQQEVNIDNCKKELLRLQEILLDKKIVIIENNEIFFKYRAINIYLKTTLNKTIEEYLYSLDATELQFISNIILEICKRFFNLCDYKTSMKYSYLSNIIYPSENAINLFRMSSLKLGEYNYFNVLTTSKFKYSPLFMDATLNIGKNFTFLSAQKLNEIFNFTINDIKIDFALLTSIMQFFLATNANISAFPKLYTLRSINIFTSLTSSHRQMAAQVRALTNEGQKSESNLIFIDSQKPYRDNINYILNLRLVLLLKLIFPSKVFILGAGHPLNKGVWNYIDLKGKGSSFFSTIDSVRKRFNRYILINDIFCAFVCDARNAEPIKNLSDAEKFASYIDKKHYLFALGEEKDLFVGVVGSSKSVQWAVENSLINLKHDPDMGFLIERKYL